MNPYLQDILHNITTRLVKLEEENKLLRQAMEDAFKGLETMIEFNKAQTERNKCE